MQLITTHRVPFIDNRALRKYRVAEPNDTRFRAAARLRQALYRQKNGWPAGFIEDPEGRRRTVGSMITPAAAASGKNFVTPEVAALAKREVAYREDQAMVDVARLWQNLLSSHPLVFNLFGPLKLDLKLATKLARRLWPDTVDRVTDVLFEHSPGRRDPAYLYDRTAFDVVLLCKNPTGQRTFIAIEVKFSETMYEPIARLRPRYDEVSAGCGLYLDPAALTLRAAPLQSLWREHMLSAAMLQRGLYDAGRFVFVAPAANRPAQQAARFYQRHLAKNPTVLFEIIDLETLITTIGSAGAPEIASNLFDRYANFSELDQFI